MNQMFFPAQLGAPQTSGQTGDTELLESVEGSEEGAFGLLMGFMQQPQLAAEWRQELAALGNSLPPEQAKALNGWLQQLSSGQLSGNPWQGLPEGMSQLIQERLPQLATQLGQAVEGMDASFKQALAQLGQGQGVMLTDGAATAAKGAGVELNPLPLSLRPQGEDASRLWQLNPLAKMIQAETALEGAGLDVETLEAEGLLDGAKPLRGLTTALPELRGADPLTRTVGTPISEASWGRNFAEQVMWVQQAGASRARLILDPPNLGPVDVELKVQGDQTSIVFHSPHQAVRDSIENNLPRLREMLAEQGVNQLDVNVSGEQPRDQRSDPDRQFFAGGSGSGGDSDGRSGEDSATTQTTLLQSGLGLVDYYA